MLPTFRRKVLGGFLVVIAVFGGLGILMVLALGAAGSIPTSLVHLNYDSIKAAYEMERAWNALRFPLEFPSLPPVAAAGQFDRALSFELGNVTEAGEAEVANGIQTIWTQARADPRAAVPTDFTAMHDLILRLIAINESAMFRRVEHATTINRLVLAGAGVTLVVTLIFVLFLSDNLATRLSNPVKAIAEALHARPSLDRELKLPPPTTIELRILIKEMRRLWSSLAEMNKLNVVQIVQQKSKLETLLDSVEDAFLVLDDGEVVTQANELMLRLLGLPSGQVIGKPWNDLSTMSDNYLVLRDVLKRKDDRESELNLALDGKPLDMTLRCRKIRGAEGKTAGLIVLIRDVTERRQRERLRAEIVDVLSHELKTPVQSLGMAADMLARHKNELSEQLRFFVETINEDVSRIRGVSQQFIDAAHAEAKSLRLDLRRINLSEAMLTWLKPFGVVAQAKGVRLAVSVEDSAAIWVRLDPVKFPWAISNLLSNALRVAPPGSTVQVVVHKSGDHASIRVIDEGPGIPEPVQRRMYEPFFQGPEGGRGVLGVGLTIAKEVVEGHEGHLVYHANAPHGAIFQINLPVSKDFTG